MSVREERRPNMNSYINLILDAEGAKERLRRLFQSAPEESAADISIADTEEEQIERTSARYSHGLIRRLACKLVR
jgi:hypothetical protein